jgi:hypothetical protein
MQTDKHGDPPKTEGESTESSRPGQGLTNKNAIAEKERTLSGGKQQALNRHGIGGRSALIVAESENPVG